MPHTFRYIVTIKAETQDLADLVMVERTGFDEGYDDPTTGEPFDYTLDWARA